MGEFKIKTEKFDRLLQLIADSDNEELQNSFLEYQEEKNDNNENWLNHIKSVCEELVGTRKGALPINIVRVCAWEDAADIDKLPLLEKAAELAGDSMFCMRVWSAWGVGTMTENDFVDAADDDDFVNDIAKAIWEGH